VSPARPDRPASRRGVGMAYASLPPTEAGPWLVRVERAGRSPVTFSCCRTRRSAERLAARLLALGCAATVTRPVPGGAR